MIQYKGAQWFKCDFHLHTPASECFLDRTVTPEAWVQACLDAGLQCVAVTDHNTGAWIDSIKDAAKGKSLTVFPGVEITCDTSKIHLLVIFDESKTTQNIEDFLLRCDIDRGKFSKQDAHSSLTIIDIAKKANDAGALVIPAHIDEFNGLAYCAGGSSVKDFYALPFVHAVQFVHEVFLEPALKVKGNQELLTSINEYYGRATAAIGENNISDAYNGIRTAKAAKKCLLTFSDNPDSKDSAKHGLSGIGYRYSWIKMDSQPSLEGIRQAFMMPDRTKHYFECKNSPYIEPRLWIRKISIQNTTITPKNEVVSVEFSPQLTTIIGGRGSGKSSILRFMRGVFGLQKDLEGLPEIKEDYDNFFKKVDEEGLGVLKDDTKVEVYYVRDKIEYRITYDNSIKKSIIERYDIIQNDYVLVSDEGFLDFFQFEEYSQKQIFSIAQKPNSLRNRIDSAIKDMDELHNSYGQLRQEYRSLKSSLRSLQRAVKDKGKLITEIKDLDGKINLLKQSNIATLLNQQQVFETQRLSLQQFLNEVKKIGEALKDLLPLYENFQPFSSDKIEEKYRGEITEILNKTVTTVKTTGETLRLKSDEMTTMLQQVVQQLKASSLIKELHESKKQFEEKKKELEEKGVTSMTDFEKYSKLIADKQKELEQIIQKESEITEHSKTIDEHIKVVAKKRAELSNRRRDFVKNHINYDKINISIRSYYDKDDFKSKFRNIVQKTKGYDQGIEKVVELVFAQGADMMTNLAKFKETMHQLHEDKLGNSPFDGRFVNLIQGLTEEQMDNIDLLYPEDQIEMRYKGRDGNFKPLSVASAGQKTTAILTFILSFGNVPLILDQPEDDLDNRLVYDLIVDKIRQIKEYRQVIVVTHNANIPVNGDAEYVVSMSSDTHNLKIQAEGTVEKEEVKNEICEVMEGGVEAFKTRAKRYESLNKS